jgi:hypothetical protein
MLGDGGNNMWAALRGVTGRAISQAAARRRKFRLGAVRRSVRGSTWIQPIYIYCFR